MSDVPPVTTKMNLWLALARCQAKVEALLSQQVRELGLTLAQHDTLMNLLLEDGLSQQKLAERLLVTKGNLTGMLKRMGDHRWIERRMDPQDARIKRVYLTQEGRDLALRAQACQHTFVEALFDSFDATSLHFFTTLADQLEGRLDLIRSEEEA